MQSKNIHVRSDLTNMSLHLIAHHQKTQNSSSDGGDLWWPS